MIVSLLSSIYEKFSQVGNLCGARDRPASEIIDLPAETENQASHPLSSVTVKHSLSSSASTPADIVSLREVFSTYFVTQCRHLKSRYLSLSKVTFLDNLKNVKLNIKKTFG